MTVRPLRILYLADIRFPLERANGIQTIETCHALAGRGHDVELAVRPDTHTPARDALDYYGLPPAPTLHILRAPVQGPAAAKRLGYLSFAAGRVMGAGRADVVLTRDLGVAALLVRLPRALRPPVVYESHGYAPDVAAALPDLIATATAPSARKLRRLAGREASVWRMAEGYVTITAGLAADLEARFGSRLHLEVIPDGARMAARPAAAADAGPDGVRRESPLVAYAGHLYAWKGVDCLLEALALVPGVRGLVVGGHAAEPDLARLQALAGRLGLADRVTFTGLVEPARVPELLRGADILVLPNPRSAISERFTSPLKLFEYLAAGRAIVASDLPAIREILHDDVDALLVPPGEARPLAAAIDRLASEPATRARLARAAAAAAPAFSWERRAARIEALLTAVAAS